MAPGRAQDAITAVLDALRLGEPFARWLIIFDNADRPEELRELLPIGPGHVIVTSRNHRWQSVADTVEVDVFSRQESLDFLRRRVPGITEDEAARLAEELGDLPLALEQAGALQAESGMSVDEYLELLAKESNKVLAENPPTDYPVGVAAAWSLSMDEVKERTPMAWELLRRLAFFGPEPIELDLLKRGRYVLGPPLQDEVGDPIQLSRATRELGRYALARVDNYHKTMQVHRLIQRLIRDGLDSSQADAMRHEVHLLLAAADPGDPDDLEKWAQYDELLAHVVPSEAMRCDHPDGRRLIRNMVRYLFNVGDLVTCDNLSNEALERWTADSGPDDRDVLILAGQRANLLWSRGAYAETYELRSETLERMRRVLGAEHEETLVVTSDHGADLRARGDFAEALELDENTLALHTQVFRDDDPRTFNVANNLAIDQGLNGLYGAAYETDTRTYQDRLDFYGRNDHPWVIHSLGSRARDLRQAGKYADALPIAEQAYAAFADVVRQRVLPPDHPWVLWQAKDLSVTRRKMGRLVEALDLAEEVYDRYVKAFGEQHPDTLAAGMNLGNARRVHGDVTENDQLLEQADQLVESTFGHYGKVYGEDHPYTLGCALNLAIVRRRRGRDPEADREARARQLLEATLVGLRRRLGDMHHYTLTCMTALATSVAATGDPEGARELGQQALEGLQARLGADHPHTLACASNLAVDLATLGQREASERLAAETIERYEHLNLPDDHFDLQDARSRKRIALDFEPLPL